MVARADRRALRSGLSETYAGLTAPAPPGRRNIPQVAIRAATDGTTPLELGAGGVSKRLGTAQLYRRRRAAAWLNVKADPRTGSRLTADQAPEIALPQISPRRRGGTAEWPPAWAR